MVDRGVKTGGDGTIDAKAARVSLALSTPPTTSSMGKYYSPPSQASCLQPTPTATLSAGLTVKLANPKVCTCAYTASPAVRR